MSQPPQPPPASPPPDRTSSLFLAISLIADISAIVALRATDQASLLLVGAGIAILLGVVVCIREGKNLKGLMLILAIGCILTGLVIGGYGLTLPAQPAHSDTQVTGTKEPEPTAAPEPDSTLPSVTEPPPSPSHKAVQPIFNGEIKLGLKTGANIDVKGTGRIEAQPAGGASGDIDLYLDYVGLLYAAGGSGLYSYTGAEPINGDACTKLRDSGSQAVTQFPVPSLQFCIVTSDNRVAWLRVSESTTSSFTTEQYAILRVKTW